MEENTNQLEITQKVKDMMGYAYPALNQFPKSEKICHGCRYQAQH